MIRSAAYIAFLMICTGCVNSMDEVQQTVSSVQPNVEQGTDIEMFYSENGMIKIRIAAPVLTRYLTEEPYVEFNKGLHVDFFNDSNRVTSVLTANYGIRYEKDLKTFVRNNVVVINENGEQLNTEELVWDERKNIIYSEKFVKITTDREVIYGEGLEADERMTKYRILKPQGTIKVTMDDAEADENI